MPAPSGIVWGSIAGGYGRIGVHTSVINKNNTEVTVNADIWFWGKYSVYDDSNTLYYSVSSSSGFSASTSLGAVAVAATIDSGEGWSTSNQCFLKTLSFTLDRTGEDQTKYIHVKLTDVDRVGAAMIVSKAFAVPAIPSYTISYNANGGSGAPSSQLKYYGTNIALHSTKPTRTGYTFQGWATSASGSVAYAAGAVYTANASVTLYAVWKANTYTVSYNANGGTGAPSSQTKTHGVALTLSSTKPTRTNYNFKGWGTSATTTTVSYAAGASYTANTDITLYAIWELSYVKPIIHSLTISRCNSSGVETNDGTCGLVKFEWACNYNVSSIKIAWEAAAETGTKTVTASGTSGSVSAVIGDNALNTDTSYTITVTVTDSGGSSSTKTTLNGFIFPVDVLAGGKGISFGKPAELEGVADFAFDAKFNKPVYGKALGMDRLPAIPANSDLNNYMEPGCYAVQSNAISETVSNIPVERAGRLEVWSSTGEGIRLEQWSYLRQRYIPYNSSNAVWEREITRNSSNVWTYYDWWKSSLTPVAAEKVYSKAAMTIAMSETTTLGAVSTYTKIPFDKVVLSTSVRLTMTQNSIRIGANIEYIKVSGQALIGCGNTNGLRHIRIRKVSSGTSKGVSWVTAYGTANSQAIYPLTPIIVSVKEGDLLDMVFYTENSADKNSAGSDANGWQTYLTVEEL